MAAGFVHFRVDDRMIHGIVASQWIPNFKSTRAMVVDEAASQSDLMRTSLKMACPAGVALSVLAPEKAASNINAGKYAAQRVFCVFRYIRSAYELFEKGVEIPQLNLGNITMNKGELTALSKTVRITAEEKEMLRKMRDAGTRITVALAVADTEIDVGNLLD